MKMLPINTIKRRHEFYKKLLEIVCADPILHVGLCYYINTICSTPISNLSHNDAPSSMSRYLPELWKEAPKIWTGPKGSFNKALFFYPLTTKGWEKRIAMIEKAIEATKPKKFKKA